MTEFNVCASRYTGKERDSESGLDNFESRYYGSSMGRFMSPDTFGGHLEEPEMLNHSSYVGNNPLSRTDPDGHDFYQQRGSSDHSGCTQVQTDPQNSKSTQWVQAGADGKATIITSTSEFLRSIFTSQSHDSDSGTLHRERGRPPCAKLVGLYELGSSNSSHLS
jgi:RHS repeat-associated protein